MDHSRSIGQRRPAGGEVPKYRPARAHQPKRGINAKKSELVATHAMQVRWWYCGPGAPLNSSRNYDLNGSRPAPPRCRPRRAEPKRNRRPPTVTLHSHWLWTRYEEPAKFGPRRTRSPSAKRRSRASPRGSSIVKLATQAELVEIHGV